MTGSPIDGGFLYDGHSNDNGAENPELLARLNVAAPVMRERGGQVIRATLAFLGVPQPDNELTIPRFGLDERAPFEGLFRKTKHHPNFDSAALAELFIITQQVHGVLNGDSLERGSWQKGLLDDLMGGRDWLETSLNDPAFSDNAKQYIESVAVRMSPEKVRRINGARLAAHILLEQTDPGQRKQRQAGLWMVFYHLLQDETMELAARAKDQGAPGKVFRGMDVLSDFAFAWVPMEQAGSIISLLQNSR